MAALLVLASCGFEVDPVPAGDAGPEPVTAGFASSTSLQDETSNNIEVRVRLSRPSTEPVIVDYEITGGSATIGQDFEATNGSVMFSPGQTEKGIPLQIKFDALEEINEDIDLMLTSATGATLVNRVHEITISANVLPRVTFSLPTSAGEETGNVMLHLALDSVSLIPTQVSYEITGGTANNQDFVLANGTVTFPAEVQSQMIQLQITQDLFDEENETVEVTLVSSVDVVIGAGNRRTHTINDDDAAPSVTIAATTTHTETDAATTANVAVTLSLQSGKPITVPFQLQQTTTANPADYAFPSTTTLSFAPGETTKNIAIGVTGDQIFEANQTVDMRLLANGLANVTLGGQVDGTLTITDDDTAPVIAFTNPGNRSESEGDSGSMDWTYNLTLTGATELACTFALALGGTAERPADYSTTTTNFTLNPGQATASITLTVVGEMAEEGPDETIEMTISTTGLENCTRTNTAADQRRTHTIDDQDPN